MRGFEGAPGHAAAPLVGERRGHYSDKPSAGSFADYPLDSYRTHGGYDYCHTAQVGGLWDALLSEGRPFYITCNSDSHLYLGDVQKFDRRNYKTTGVVAPPASRAATVRPTSEATPTTRRGYTETRSLPIDATPFRSYPACAVATCTPASVA